MRNSGCNVPNWMLALPPPSQKAKKKLRHQPVKRKDVSASVGYMGVKRVSRDAKERNRRLHKAKEPSKAVRIAHESEEERST